MSIDGELTHHLIAELFARTSEMMKTIDPKLRDDVLNAHEEMLIVLMNSKQLLISYPCNKKQLSGIRRSFVHGSYGPPVGITETAAPKVTVNRDSPLAPPDAEAGSI